MIRYVYVNNLVLQLYKSLPQIKFPIDPKTIIELLPNCKYMSYQKFAQINNCSIDDVIQLCESTSGCTHYDIATNRYLILCNESTDNNNNKGRQRWTCSHEIGHIVCNHHDISAQEKLAENNLMKNNNPDFEAEADYFAATLLAPFPLFKQLYIESDSDIHFIFGLSIEASSYRFKEYITWKNHHWKTAWENDMVKNYNKKRIL